MQPNLHKLIVVQRLQMCIDTQKNLKGKKSTSYLSTQCIYLSQTLDAFCGDAQFSLL